MQTEAIKNIKIDNVTVWDGGQQGDGKSSTAGFISGLYKSVPPLRDLFDMAGMDLPGYLGKKQEGWGVRATRASSLMHSLVLLTTPQPVTDTRKQDGIPRTALWLLLRSAIAVFLLCAMHAVHAQGGLRLVLYNFEPVLEKDGLSPHYGIGYDHDLNERMSSALWRGSIWTTIASW